MENTNGHDLLAPTRHQRYLDSLSEPTPDESQVITECQIQHENEIDAKYHSGEENKAATKIQKAYRGHRERRQLQGLTLNPSSRWLEAIKEWRYRSAIAPHYSSRSPHRDGQPLTPTDVARQNWRRVTQIAEHAVGGEPVRSRSNADSNSLRPVEDADGTLAGSMLMDLRYFLEMVDQKHRYGANLQIYHEEWRRKNTSQSFFYWLDRGYGRHISLPGCSREKLDRERIRYLSKEERRYYLVDVDDQGKLRWAKNDQLITTSTDSYKDSMHGIVPKGATEPTFSDASVIEQLAEERHFARNKGGLGNGTIGKVDSSDSSGEESEDSDTGLAYHPPAKDETPRKRFHVSPATIFNHLLRASVKPGTWIYVADTVGRLYVSIKSSGSFQHASFLAGSRISSAGSIGIKNGQLTYLSPLSGHYRPTTASFKSFIDNLKDQGADLSKLRVSGAYKVLLGIEYYGKIKQRQRKVTRRRDGSRADISPSPIIEEQVLDILHERDQLSAADTVESNWDRQRRRGLAKLMDDLHIRRRSQEIKRDEL